MAHTIHPLQRLASPSRSISAIIHILGIASFSASFRWLFLYPSPENEKFGGVFQFLTIIGLALALTSMVLGLLADVTLSSTLFNAKNVISVCSTPLEVLVSILYWGITLIDKRLLVPEEYQLPFWPDFGFHASKLLLETVTPIVCVCSLSWAVRDHGKGWKLRDRPWAERTCCIPSKHMKSMIVLLMTNVGLCSASDNVDIGSPAPQSAMDHQVPGRIDSQHLPRICLL